MKSITETMMELIREPGMAMDGAYNIREDSGCAGRRSNEWVQIKSKSDVSGIDITVKPGTKGETVYIPAFVTHTDLMDLVYNDFYIGAGADVTIVAGCGVHNDGDHDSQHDGIHRFFIGEGAKVRYLEKHIGLGDGSGKRIINPVTRVEIGKDGYMEMDTTQIKGVDSTKRVTTGTVDEGGKLVIKEKLMTHGQQFAETEFAVDLNGAGSGADVVSRSVAKDDSKQVFRSVINGNAACTGHSACDAIIMGNALVTAVPELTANHVDAALIHEAAIGKIAGEQLVKLMTLGLTEEQAEARIIEGFLK